MFFRKTIDGVAMGAELARLYGRHVFHVMYLLDNVASGFTLDAKTYQPLESRIPYPYQGAMWVFALMEVSVAWSLGSC